MLQVIHAFGSKDAAFDYLKKLQDNDVGPSASTGKLTALVNKGELYVANGDLQMNMSQMTESPNIKGLLGGRSEWRTLGHAAALLRWPGRRRA
jgi:2-aminoethylphosphonate transport system substrate-binding protein